MALGDIILLKNKTPLGPFTRAQIQEGISRGEFSGRDLAHTPGLKDWLPLDELLHHLDHDVVKPTRASTARTLPPLPGSKNFIAPPAMPITEETPKEVPQELSPTLHAKEVFDSPPQLAPPVAMKNEGPPPAPIGARFLAWVIDWAVLFVPILVLFGFGYAVSSIQGVAEHLDEETLRQEHALLWRNLCELLLLVATGFGWLYGAGLESSRWQATVGKQWMGIIVTDSAGQRLTFLRATGRHAGKYLSAVPFFIGFMAALFNARRLAWHDRLADTRVVRKEENLWPPSPS